MTTQRSTRWLGALAALLLAAAALVLAAPAQASIKTVRLTAQGPSPAQITLVRGDVVNFFNTDNVSHKVDRTSGGWAFSAVIEANKGRATEPFTTSGTFGYTDSYTLVALPQQAPGSIVVPASTPSPTPKPTVKPTSTPKPTPKPTASSTPSPTPGPTRSGTAIGPGLGVGGFPTATPGPTTAPQPDLASPLPSASGAVAAVRYADRRLVQDSPHRYGLPAALAIVAIVGLVSLLVRWLLAQPEATRRRTGKA